MTTNPDRIETDRLHAEILEGQAQISELRDLLRSENQRANAAIERETTAEQAAIEAQEEAHRLRAVVARVRRLHDALDAETDLTSPDHEITRGAAARKIAAALDGWSPPASHCPHAAHTLQWGLHPDSTTQGWILRNTTSVVAVLDGYPIGRPPVLADEARAWADGILGACQGWVEQPARSDAYHAHSSTAEVRQDAPLPQEPPVVAYRSPGGHYLYCTRHTDELGASWTPLLSDDLPDGGLCSHSECGVDVLIPQDGAQP